MFGRNHCDYCDNGCSLCRDDSTDHEPSRNLYESNVKQICNALVTLGEMLEIDPDGPPITHGSTGTSIVDALATLRMVREMLERDSIAAAAGARRVAEMELMMAEEKAKQTAEKIAELKSRLR